MSLSDGDESCFENWLKKEKSNTAGIRHAAAAAVDADVTQLLADLTTYFALQQSNHDVDVRQLVVRWLAGKLINLDQQTAAAFRYANLEDPTCWDKTLVAVDPLAGA